MKVTPITLDVGMQDPDALYNAVRGRDGKDTYLLESAEGGEKVARYSFIGFNPAAKLTIRGKKASLDIIDPQLKGLKSTASDPLEIMRELISQFELATAGPRFFGGFVGYYSYDIIRNSIQLPESGPKAKPDDLKEPDCEFILAKNNFIIDHKDGITLLTQNEFGDKVDEKAVKESLDEIMDSLDFKPVPELPKKKVTLHSNTSKAEYEKSVLDAIEYIKAGDIFQVVLSQRFGADFDGDTFAVFRALKEINPSPYMYHLDFGERKIVGSSPEMLARVEGETVVTYPIAGTRKRGKNQDEDDALAKEMLSDEKERAEHIMLVDLGRNDVGRIAKYGSVKVSKLMEVEKYSHVQHIVSEVVGELREDMDEIDALKSIFPAGTVSGAPKVRAMEIIDELEKARRGIYAGCVGYFSFNRNMDTAITIRTIVFEGDKAYIQAGAGIVVDSKPEKEYQETVNKAKGMAKALGGELG